MRINVEQLDFFKNYWHGKANVFLFGSRTDDNALGGDIDIALVTDNQIHHAAIYKMKELFYQKFGKQKLDIKVLKTNDNSKFAKHIFNYAIPL